MPPPRVSDTRPRRVALTGGIATGKSHVRARFEELGVPTIDADALARDVVAPGTPGLAAVVQRFGSDVLDPAGMLDRRKLANVVFGSEEQRRALEAIIHPAVRKAIDAWYSSLDSSHAFAIADIPLLYEGGQDRSFSRVIVTAVDPEEQVRRVIARDRLTEPEARRRVAAQMPIAEKIGRADFVIRTDGSFADTAARVREVFEALSVGR